MILFQYRNKTQQILTHVAFWLLYLVFFSVLASLNSKMSFFHFILNGLIFIPVDIFATYMTIYWLLPKYLMRKRYVAFFLLFAVLAVATVFVNQIISYFIYLPLLFPELIEKIGFFDLNYWYLLISTYTVVALAAGIKLMKLWVKGQQDKTSLETQNIRSELMLLKSQINPHFLFNTLNNIDSLVHTNQAKASESIVRLSDILRYVTYDNQNDFVPIEKEEQYLRSFVELNALRFGEGYISYISDIGSAGRMIAPMLLIPLVENAMKHGDRKMKLPAVTIQLTVDEHIAFSVVNYIAPADNSKDNTGGIGLANLKRRLELLYPNDHRFEITTTDDHKFIASLWIR